ncbi:hypothetical protein RvY_12633-2 [Ramazzottius varieornatus]|uniref:ZP domain-containing protein n=1 Tax=Ramazzottius varieornatus TaxID=947166 RepID=A0A1D1VQL6_RAMVA|nr:hypothetical protein RvY_12633-2 [Ramazzottius varieornatus]
MTSYHRYSALITLFLVSIGQRQEVATQEAQAHTPGEHDFIRVEVELVQLLNPEGLLANGQKCDNSGQCDPRITVHLDTDRPLTVWPGAKPLEEFQDFFSASNQNSPIINKNVSRNICGGSVNKVNLRAHVVDSDVLSSGGVIDDFECIFEADYGKVASSPSSAEWSATRDCRPRLQNNQARLQFRYRLVDIARSDCGVMGAMQTQIRS